jgi:hypothetical protein
MDEYNIEPDSGAPACNFDELGHHPDFVLDSGAAILR